MLATSFQLITRLRPDCFTFCNTCHVISLYWYFKNCQPKMYCECYNTQLFITFKWEQILQTRSHIMMKSQHNSVLHAFSVPDWSEMCGVVGVLTVLLLLPTQYTAGEIFKMWCQEFDKYLLANIYTQRTHDEIITSLWRRNDVATSFWRHNDVIIASCARWV